MKTLKEFAKENEEFKKACERVGLPFDKVVSKGKPGGKNDLTRQASKWKRKEGLAWTEGRFKDEQA